jgi:hypothetical protein
MRMYEKAILVLLAAALLLSMLPLGWAQVEKRSGEAFSENLFDKGIGKPWVGGDPSAWNTGTGYNHMQFAASLDPNYQVIGYLDVTTGLIVASDSGKSLHFMPGPGSYPVYGYFTENKIRGIFIDFSSSGMGM